ncbi:hypothetical protein PPERSA_13130 [Pseudocohnilembus persalinus]|uniref:Uncharacterized protein n=1 Tax=Pseudocohnilembus persalinus TaxID=266149 RepID=A0A0V0QWP2_PSEPJ|nr:hypothetical protein PPERSA_13130 [Pseudocohnilembus persalinus]|eukprot:KRX06651.1 hypothetical protein PPERSA_13130 [Pseudocohnilembus persalinus]
MSNNQRFSFSDTQFENMLKNNSSINQKGSEQNSQNNSMIYNQGQKDKSGGIGENMETAQFNQSKSQNLSRNNSSYSFQSPKFFFEENLAQKLQVIQNQLQNNSNLNSQRKGRSEDQILEKYQNQNQKQQSQGSKRGLLKVSRIENPQTRVIHKGSPSSQRNQKKNQVQINQRLNEMHLGIQKDQDMENKQQYNDEDDENNNQKDNQNKENPGKQDEILQHKLHSLNYSNIIPNSENKYQPEFDYSIQKEPKKIENFNVREIKSMEQHNRYNRYHRIQNGSYNNSLERGDQNISANQNKNNQIFDNSYHNFQRENQDIDLEIQAKNFAKKIENVEIDQMNMELLQSKIIIEELQMKEKKLMEIIKEKSQQIKQMDLVYKNIQIENETLRKQMLENEIKIKEIGSQKLNLQDEAFLQQGKEIANLMRDKQELEKKMLKILLQNEELLAENVKVKIENSEITKELEQLKNSRKFELIRQNSMPYTQKNEHSYDQYNINQSKNQNQYVQSKYSTCVTNNQSPYSQQKKQYSSFYKSNQHNYKDTSDFLNNQYEKESKYHKSKENQNNQKKGHQRSQSWFQDSSHNYSSPDIQINNNISNIEKQQIQSSQNLNQQNENQCFPNYASANNQSHQYSLDNQIFNEQQLNNQIRKNIMNNNEQSLNSVITGTNQSSQKKKNLTSFSQLYNQSGSNNNSFVQNHNNNHSYYNVNSQIRNQDNYHLNQKRNSDVQIKNQNQQQQFKQQQILVNNDCENIDFKQAWRWIKQVITDKLVEHKYLQKQFKKNQQVQLYFERLKFQLKTKHNYANDYNLGVILEELENIIQNN